MKMARIDTALNNVAVRRLYSRSGNGSSPVSTCTASERGVDPFHYTVLTLASLSVSVVGATGIGFGGTKIYDFPVGIIHVLGVTVNITYDTSGCDLDDADGGDFGCGTTAPDDATITGTDVDLCPSTSVDPLSGGGTAYLAANALFDGHSTAKDMYFNQLIDDADIGATEALLVNGTIIVTWVQLGDY